MNMRYYYCWRCEEKVPMLDEGEFSELAPLLSQSLKNVKNYREEKAASLQEALKQGFDAPARDKYEEMTGYRIADIDEIRNHRLSKYGPECLQCGSLLRTSQASRCVECGTPVENRAGD